jgi:benzoyl-CoA reductase/2-hydroxyglutaryl-CoA dehydratase subunit BcrC/BadD/HgdB
MTLPTDPLAHLRAAYQQRSSAALAARANGRKVVGYIGTCVPVELIAAAGCFPVQLTGEPGEPTPLAADFLDDDFEGDVRSLFQRIVGGAFNHVDLVVIPRTSNSYLYLYYLLHEAKRWLPGQVFPEAYLFDVLHTPYASTGEYVYGRVVAFKERLEQLAGSAIDADALRSAIARANDNRLALQAVNDMRRQAVPAIGGTDVLRAIGAARFMDMDEHTALAHALLAQACAPASGPRLMVKGAPHDHDGFYELVEAQGAVIVADDHLAGERTIERLVDDTAEPLVSLAHHYHLHMPSIRSYPQTQQDRRFLEIVDAAGVQGVIFFHDEFDDTLGWDYPGQKKLLDERGIPSVWLQKQAYGSPDREAQAAAVRALVERIAA